MMFARKWMEVEIITLSEINQVQKAKYHFCSYVESRPNMMIRVVVMTMTMTMGHECKRETEWVKGSWEG
jgi:hypothetical protein